MKIENNFLSSKYNIIILNIQNHHEFKPKVKQIKNRIALKITSKKKLWSVFKLFKFVQNPFKPSLLGHFCSIVNKVISDLGGVEGRFGALYPFRNRMRFTVLAILKFSVVESLKWRVSCAHGSIEDGICAKRHSQLKLRRKGAEIAY